MSTPTTAAVLPTPRAGAAGAAPAVPAPAPAQPDAALLRTPAWGAALDAARPERVGTVRGVVGLTVEVAGTGAAVGELVSIDPGDGTEVPAEVVATGRGSAQAMPLGPTHGLRAGMPVRPRGTALTAPVGPGLLGRVLDGLGRPIDGKGPLLGVGAAEVTGHAPHPLARARVAQPLDLGVRVLDTLVTAGRGQRLGLFAGSGVGKSSLLSMIARGTDAQVSVIALVGERGREVREFLEDDLGPEGLARSVVVVATSDEPPLVRLRSAFVATRIAEWFRDRGDDVVLMMDSLTRVAMAQREIGLSVGEPPATRGYPPSTFALLAQLLERAGTGATGSVTGLYTVLVDGDDHNEPIADATRGILDGHIVMERAIAERGRFPAINVLKSISRTMPGCHQPHEREIVTSARQTLSAYANMEELIRIGAYRAGADPQVDRAIVLNPALEEFLSQRPDEVSGLEASFATLSQILSDG